MSTMTLSGLGLTLLIWADTLFFLLPVRRLLAFGQGNERQVLGAGVVGGRADDLAVDALLDHVRGPAGSARDHEERREHRRGHAHHVVRRRAIPVEIREHLLF